MGESSAATVREIEDIRGRLEASFEELERRMPAPAIWGKRLAGIAIGGGATALVLRSLLKRRSSGRSSAPVVEMAQASPGGRLKPLVVLGAGALIALHVMELRQLRRLGQAVPRDRY